jgi:hypothetical protein
MVDRKDNINERKDEMNDSKDEMNDGKRNITKDQDPRVQLLPLPRPAAIGYSGPI